jgi:hypothetical protein
MQHEMYLYEKICRFHFVKGKENACKTNNNLPNFNIFLYCSRLFFKVGNEKIINKSMGLSKENTISGHISSNAKSLDFKTRK